jgi:hypothetical protein
VKTGSTISTHATGRIDFGGAVVGGGKVITDANGDDFPTPSDYPAPDLRKNSLFVRIGGERYQGGVEKSFVATEPGILTLQPNDGHPDDNSRGWLVSVTSSAPGASEKETEFVNDPMEYSTLPVSNSVRDWHTEVPAGARVNTLSDGQVDFGSPWPFQVIADADGTDLFAPQDYPVPPLRQNSLIC